MLTFLTQDGDISHTQITHDHLMGCLVGQSERTIVGLLFYTEILLGIGINAHNLLACFQRSLQGRAQQRFQFHVFHIILPNVHSGQIFILSIFFYFSFPAAIHLYRADSLS